MNYSMNIEDESFDERQWWIIPRTARRMNNLTNIETDELFDERRWWIVRRIALRCKNQGFAGFLGPPDSRIPSGRIRAGNPFIIISKYFFSVYFFLFPYSSAYSSFFHPFFGDVASRQSFLFSLSFIPRAHMLILFFIFMNQKRRNHAN